MIRQVGEAVVGMDVVVIVKMMKWEVSKSIRSKSDISWLLLSIGMGRLMMQMILHLI